MLVTKKAVPGRTADRLREAYITATILITQGYACYPCNYNKIPTTPHGYKDATRDPAELKALWNKPPGILPAVATGEISAVDVLDIDPRNGGNTWLEAHRHKLPVTRMHQSRSGGCHYIFRHHSCLRCSNGKVASGVDIKADGGGAIWWPALGYTTINEDIIADWPTWLLDLLKPKPRPQIIRPQRVHSPNSRYSSAALQYGAAEVSSAPTGSRNDTLFRVTCSLLRFYETGELQAQDIANEMTFGALQAGLNEKEISTTIVSAFRIRGLA